MRKYDAEFKQRAVKLYRSSEKSYTELGTELGIPPATLSTWIHNTKKIAQQPSVGQNDKGGDFSQELRHLKRELSVLKEERDILKKALAIFSIDAPKR